MFAPADRNKIYRTALTLCVLTFMLIVWGGHVNTTRSGMAFPDWPTSNFAPMVTYAPSEWLWQGGSILGAWTSSLRQSCSVS